MTTQVCALVCAQPEGPDAAEALAALGEAGHLVLVLGQEGPPPEGGAEEAAEDEGLELSKLALADEVILVGPAQGARVLAALAAAAQLGKAVRPWAGRT